MAVALGDVELQRVVIGFAGGFGVLRVGIEADEGDAERGVAAAEAFDERRDVFGGDAGNGVAVGVDLAVDGTRRRGDVGLIERNRDDFVDAVIADEGESEHEVVAGLPLQVERVVFGVGQLVGRVVAREDERAAERDAVGGAVGRGVGDELRDVGNERGDAGKILRRRGRRSGAERSRKGGAGLAVERNGEGLLHGDAERAADAAAGAL